MSAIDWSTAIDDAERRLAAVNYAMTLQAECEKLRILLDSAVATGQFFQNERTRIAAERDEVLAALLRFVELDDANTLRDEWKAGPGPGMGDYFQSDDLCAAVTAARAILAKHQDKGEKG